MASVQDVQARSDHGWQALLREMVGIRPGLAELYYGVPIRFPWRSVRHLKRFDFEPEKKKFLEQECLEGSTVLDLGAHIGTFTVLMSRFVGPEGRVLAFEPTRRSRRILEKTVVINRCANVRIRPEAIMDKSGVFTLHDAGSVLSRNNALVERCDTFKSETVAVVGIDELNLDNVSCIKMDIEGSELHGLTGAANLIAACRPSIALEVHPWLLSQQGGSAEEVWEWLEKQEYRVSCEGRLLGRTGFMAHERCFEVTAMPAEKWH